MKQVVENVVLKSGIWAGQQRQTHGFLLTPEVFRLSESQHQWLREFGLALHGCLAGAGRIAAVACDTDLNCNTTGWRLARQVAKKEVTFRHRDIQHLHPNHVPFIIKTDWVEDQSGQLRLVEIDAMNRRGLGYTTLFNRVRDTLYPEAQVLPGVARLIADEMVRRRRAELIFLYAHKERFYLPEFMVFAAEMRKYGVEVVLSDELELEVREKKVVIRGEEKHDPLFVNFPVFSKKGRTEVELAQLYRHEEIELLMPPKSFLGSKGLLALLKNESNDQNLESILGSQIDPKALTLVRESLPCTHMITLRSPEELGDGRWVLKETISAGTKGVVFSDDPSFQDAFKSARRASYKYVLQETVKGKQRQFRYWQNGQEEVSVADWYTRVIIYFVGRQPADVVVTACQDKLVHGGKQAINMGSIIAP